MEGECFLDGIILQKLLAGTEFFEKLHGQILTGKQDAKPGRTDRVLFQQGGENGWRRVIEKRVELLADGRTGTLHVIFEIAHESSLLRSRLDQSRAADGCGNKRTAMRA